MLYLMIICKLDTKLNFWSFKSMAGHTEIWSAYDRGLFSDRVAKSACSDVSNLDSLNQLSIMSNGKHWGFLLSDIPAGRGDSCRIGSWTHPSKPPPCGLCLSHGCPYLLEMCMGESCGRCAPRESMGWFPRSPHTATPEACNCPSRAAQP